jgi:hypothetical protein
MSAVKGFAMSVVARRAFALLLLAGAVGASLALPAIFDGAQQASRGIPPVSVDTTTTHVFASLPIAAAAKPKSVVRATRLAPAVPRPVARRVAPTVRPRAHVVAAAPVAAVTPTPPVAAPAAAPAPEPPVSAVPTDQTATKVIASTLASTTPPAESGSGKSSYKQADRSSDHGNSKQGDHGNDKQADPGNNKQADPGNNKQGDHGNGNDAVQHGNGHGKGR